MTNLLEYCESNDLKIMFMLQGFLIFAQHYTGNNQVREDIKMTIH